MPLAESARMAAFCQGVRWLLPRGIVDCVRQDIRVMEPFQPYGKNFFNITLHICSVICIFAPNCIIRGDSPLYCDIEDIV